MNAIRNIPEYRPAGQPAYCWIQIPNVPPIGKRVTINGDAYVFNTDFFGQSAAQVAASLVHAIRAEQQEQWAVSPSNTSFFRAYSAFYVGSYVVVFCAQPGIAGNAFTLTTDYPASFVISGATFTGGTNLTGSVANPPNTGTPTDRSGTMTAGGTAQQVMAANASRVYLFVQNISAEDMYVRWTGTATAAQGSILLKPNGSVSYDSNFVPTGAVSIISATTGSKYTAIEA